MVDVDAVVAVAMLLLWVYCIFDVIASDGALIRNLPKTFWLLIVIILPDIGALAWLLLGRPEKAGWRPGDTTQREQRWSGARRARGPEDQAIISESMAERERLIAGWDAEEAARKQRRREEVDAETQARKRAAEEQLLHARRQEREAQKLRAMEMPLPAPEEPPPGA